MTRPDAACGAAHLPLQRAARPLGHREFACQAKRRRLCKLIAFGSFPRHRSVVVVAAGRLDGGNERRELTRGRDERPFRRLPCAMRGAFAAEKRECASLRSVAGGRDPRRAAGALNGAPRKATRSSPPSFRVAMPESPALIPIMTSMNSPVARVAQLRSREVLCSAVAPSRSFPLLVTTQPIGAVRATQTLLTRALRAASSRRERIYHVKQDDYRRLPPGRDPGGRTEG